MRVTQALHLVSRQSKCQDTGFNIPSFCKMFRQPSRLNDFL